MYPKRSEILFNTLLEHSKNNSRDELINEQRNYINTLKEGIDLYKSRLVEKDETIKIQDDTIKTLEATIEILKKDKKRSFFDRIFGI